MQNKEAKILAFFSDLTDYIDAIASEKAKDYAADDSCAGLNEALRVMNSRKSLEKSLDNLFEDF